MSIYVDLYSNSIILYSLSIEQRHLDDNKRKNDDIFYIKITTKIFKLFILNNKVIKKLARKSLLNYININFKIEVKPTILG